MIHLVGIPVDLVDIMTFRAVGGEVVLDVVRTGGGLKILEVAVDTIITQPVEPETGFRVVAIGTADGGVGADQWKSVVEVDLGDIVHQPVVGCMTTSTILPHRLLVDIVMARDTFRAGIRKDHRCVAAPAIYQGMLTLQVEPCGFMAEGHVFPQRCPTSSGVTICTVDGKLLTVG